MPASGPAQHEFTHRLLDSGVELAVDHLPDRDTVAITVRVLTGVVDDPPELTGIGSIVAQTLSKGTERYDGRALANAFDALGAEWAVTSGRQTTVARAVCLPEFVEGLIELVAEMLRRPAFPDEACEVAVRLALEELRHLEDNPQSLLGVDIERLTLGDVLGRNPTGERETLARITPEQVRAHWRRNYHAGRIQVAVAGPVDAACLAGWVDRALAGFGRSDPHGRRDAEYTFRPGRHHRQKDLQQEYIGITLPGAARGDRDYPTERVLLGVLAGGMSGRLFTEVREKLGLVYWVGAWSEQPRGRGVIHLAASTTPERCEKTFSTILRELERLPRDLTDAETQRARDGLIAHLETEDDLTRARAGALSDDLFYFSRPVGLEARLAELRAVTTEMVADYAARLPRDRLCVATVGPRALQV